MTRGPLLPLLLTAALPPGPLAGASGEELASEELASGLQHLCSERTLHRAPRPGCQAHTAFCISSCDSPVGGCDLHFIGKETEAPRG